MLFRFPTNPMVREKWNDFVTENCLKVNDINKHSLLCSSHFDASLFFQHKNGRRLTKNAVSNIKICRVVKVSFLAVG